MIKVGQTTTNQTIALPYELTNDGDTSISLQELKGNTTQNGTPTPTSPVNVNVVKGSKNILDNTQGTTQTINGITFTKNSDGTLTANGTATAGITYYVNGSDSRWQQIPSGTYVLSDGTSSPSSSTYFTYLDIQGQDSLYLSTASTKTRTYSSYYNCRARIVVRNGVTLNNLVFKVQLEQGSTATPYLPYNTIQAKVVGKNLLENNSITQTKNGVTYTINQDKSITLNGTSTQAFVVEINNDLVLDSGNYNLSLKGKIQGCGIYAYVGASVLKVYVSSSSTTDNYQSNFTLDTRTTFTQIRIDIQANKTFNNVTIYPQLEKSSTATTYEAYKSQTYPITLGDIELCKIGNYQDRIYKNNGKWYLEKQVGKVVLNGTENWTYNSSSGMPYTLAMTNIKRPSTQNEAPLLITNYYETKSFNDASSVQSSITMTSTADNLRVRNTSITSLADFKTWLGTHNTIVYYILQTPTTTEITDETLLEQLDAIGELYRGTNNIMITDTIAPVENIIIEKSNAEFDLVPYIKREPKLDYIDRKGDTGYTADGHYFENIIARKRGLEFELIPMSQENYLTVISNFIDKTQIPVYIDDLFTGETNLIQTYKKEKIPTKQITENGIVRGTTIKLEEI